jgi:hypothetical protein
MIESSHQWATTPAVCNTCGKKFQLVFETDIIKDGDKESWKLPKDFCCERCGSDDILFPDFENKDK